MQNFSTPLFKYEVSACGEGGGKSAQGFSSWLRETEPSKHQVEWRKADIMYSTSQVVTHHFRIIQLLAEKWDVCRNSHISFPALGDALSVPRLAA